MTPILTQGGCKDNPIDIDLSFESERSVAANHLRDPKREGSGEKVSAIVSNDNNRNGNGYNNSQSLRLFGKFPDRADVAVWLQNHGHVTLEEGSSALSQDVEKKTGLTNPLEMAAKAGDVGNDQISPPVTCSAPNGASEGKSAIAGIYMERSTQPLAKNTEPANGFKNNTKIIHTLNQMASDRPEKARRKMSSISSSAAASPATSSVPSIPGNKCAMCHKGRKTGEPRLVPCSKCLKAFHLTCHEITKTILNELGDQWKCSQCAGKRQGKPNGASKGLKRPNDKIGASMQPPVKKARIISPERNGYDRRHISGESQRTGVNHPAGLASVSSRSKYEVERRSDKPAQTPRRKLPWSSTPTSSQSQARTQTPNGIRSSHGMKRPSSLPNQDAQHGGQLLRPVAPVRSSPTSVSAVKSKLPHGRNNPTVSEDTSFPGKPQSSQNYKDDAKVSSKPGVLLESTDRAANMVSSRLGAPLGKADNHSSALKNISTEGRTAATPPALPGLSRPSDALTQSNTNSPKLVSQAGPVAVLKGLSSKFSLEQVSQSSHGEDRDHGSKVDATPMPENITLDSRIKPWLEEVSGQVPIIHGKQPEINGVASAPSKHQFDQELSDESMSIDTLSSRKGEVVEKQFHAADERSDAVSKTRSDLGKIGGEGTDKESSPPYSPPPAEEYIPFMRRCHSTECPRKGEVFIEHLWCKLHAEAYRRSRPAAEPKQDDVLSPLFGGNESTSPTTLSTSTSTGEESVSIDRCESIHQKPQKSERIRSEKGMRALSEKSPTKSQQELEKENLGQKQALQRHAKRVSELERDLKQTNLLAKSRGESLTAAKQAVVEAKETAERLLEDNARLHKESDHLRETVTENEKRIQEFDRQKAQRATKAERENEDLMRQIELLKLDSKKAHEKSDQLKKENNNLRGSLQAEEKPPRGKYECMTFDVLDPTSGLEDHGVLPRRSCRRKGKSHLFHAQNLRAAPLQIHWETDSVSGCPAMGDVRVTRRASAPADPLSLDPQSASDALDSDFSSAVAARSTRKKVTQGRMTFEEFMELPSKMVPAQITSKKDIAFRPLSLKTRRNSTFQDRNTPTYRIGRDVPGELRN